MHAHKLLVLLGLQFLSLPLASQDGIAWETDYDAAFKKAKAENRPIMVAFIMKGESANEEIVRNHFHNKELIEQSRRFVCLIGCIGLHGEKGESPCSAFPGITCADHERVEMRARISILEASLVSAPQFVFLAPDGKTMLLRHVWALAPIELVNKLKMAHAYFDPTSAPAGFKDKRDLVTRLIDDASGENQDKRRTGLATLAKHDDPKVTEFLMKQTANGVDLQKRLEAIFYMRDRGNAKVLPLLHKLIASEDSQIRMYTAVALEGIAMVESSGPLKQAFDKEGKDRIRSHIVRALFACATDDKTRRDVVMKLLASTSQLDQILGLYQAINLKRDADLDKALLKSMNSTVTQVRVAAYFAIGSLKVEKAKDPIERKIGSERDPAKSAAQWALEQLGGPSYTGELDVASETLDQLPDNGLYEGDVDGGTNNSNKSPGGRGGGGRGGRR